MELPEDWAAALAPFVDRPAFERLADAVAAARRTSTVYPPEHLVFEAFRRTPFSKVKVVFLGQDPYHGPGQACGLAFAVPPGVAPPPSLANLFRELQADLGHLPPRHGWLGAWADAGVLLLNTVLTVRAHEAASHQGFGWEAFTDAVIDALVQRPGPVVFALLGGPAQQKAERLRDRPRVEVAHPSPLSYARFRGCRLFSKLDAALPEPLDWSLPSAPGDGPDLTPRSDPAVDAVRGRPTPATLRHLLTLPVWAARRDAACQTIAAAVSRVLPRRFTFRDLATFRVGEAERVVARFTFDDPDRGARTFHLIPGGSGTLGYEPRKAKLTPAHRALFATLAAAHDWPPQAEDWLTAELTPAHPMAIAPFLIDVDPPISDDALASPARDLDETGQITAALAIDGLRLPTPDELSWALSGAAPGLFPWGTAWPFHEPLPERSAFGVPWPTGAWRTADPDADKPRVGPADPTTATGWLHAIGWSPARFERAHGPRYIVRVRPLVPFDRRSA